MSTVILLNGPVNGGKSSVGRALASLLPGAVFVDGDDHDAPDDASLAARIEAALQRIETRIAEIAGDCLIVAYPLDQTHYDRVRAAADRRGARLLVLTLAPPLWVALSDRGDRRLAPGERARILEMYREGYHARPFSDAILDTAGLTPDQSARRAAEMLFGAACLCDPS